MVYASDLNRLPSLMSEVRMPVFFVLMMLVMALDLPM